LDCNQKAFEQKQRKIGISTGRENSREELAKITA